MPSAHTVTPSPPLPPRWIHWPRWVRRHHRGARWQWNAWQVFLLPTPFGWLYGGALGALFLFAANYQLSLAYLLLFVISAFGVTAAVQTVRVAHGVTFTAQPPEWVFAGDPVTWTLHWHAPLDAQGSALTVSAVTPDGHVVARRVLFDGAAGAVTLALPTHRRGAYPAPCFTLGAFSCLGGLAPAAYRMGGTTTVARRSTAAPHVHAARHRFGTRARAAGRRGGLGRLACRAARRTPAPRAHAAVGAPG